MSKNIAPKKTARYMSKKLTPKQKARNQYIRHIRSQVKVLNKRRGALLRENARYGIEIDSTDDTLMEEWRARTNTKSINSLSTGRLTHMSLKKLKKLSEFIDEYAGYRDEKGNLKGAHRRHYNARERARMGMKQIETFNQRHYKNKKDAADNLAAALDIEPDYSEVKKMTRLQHRRMIALFSSEDLATLREATLFESEQIVNLAKEMTEDMMGRLPEAIDSMYKLFGNNMKLMRVYQQHDPQGFREILQAYMIPVADIRQKALEDNPMYRALKGI